MVRGGYRTRMLSIAFPPPSVQHPSGQIRRPDPEWVLPPVQEPAGTPRNPLLVVVSLDVEEEGLFSGRYAATGCTVRNVAELRRLEPLSRELGFPLTLLCAYSVFGDVGARSVLARLRDEAGAEIGAHLHHWSTPPLTLAPASSPPSFPTPSQSPRQLSDRSQPLAEADEKKDVPAGPPLRTHRVPRELLRQRLRTLLDAGRDFQGAPLTSFRMGRWDLKAHLRPLLAEEGILVDSSVCPLRAFGAGQGGQGRDSQGPDHFLAPPDPYWIMPSQAGGETTQGQHPPLLEVPITHVPLHPALARGWYALLAGKAGLGSHLDNFRLWGALSPNPVWHHARVMRMATRLHVARGGRVLSLFWHSSEMLPGGSPHIPDAAAATALVEKVRQFLTWLRTTYTVRGVTLSELYGVPGFALHPCGTGIPQGDW